MVIQIRIQQLKFMRIHAEPDPDADPCGTGSGCGSTTLLTAKLTGLVESMREVEESRAQRRVHNQKHRAKRARALNTAGLKGQSYECSLKKLK